jgi:hypothetical protein
MLQLRLLGESTTWSISWRSKLKGRGSKPESWRRRMRDRIKLGKRFTKQARKFQKRAEATMKGDETDIFTSESSDNDEDDEYRESVEEILTYWQDLLDNKYDTQSEDDS